ncbi:DUF285 domain-containing protein [Organic Lake phycodnavirus 1]|nr:DUF285 domain-containing protein [Organic Lake phycodnavirus 1]
MDLSFQHEIIGNIKPYWGFYKTSGQIIGYKEDNDIFFDTITDAFTYLSNEDISSVTGNQYNFTLSNESPTSFNVENVPNGPLFAIYQDTYYNITENNIFSAVNKWRYDYFDALALYGPISEWKLVNVLNMNGLFEDYSDFNEDIGQWNTSTVTNMESMFKVRHIQSRYWSMEYKHGHFDGVYVSRCANVQSRHKWLDCIYGKFDGVYVSKRVIIQSNDWRMEHIACYIYGFNVQWRVVIQSVTLQLERHRVY